MRFLVNIILWRIAPYKPTTRRNAFEFARLHIEKGIDFPYLNIMRLQIVFFSIIAIALGSR